MDAPNRTHPAPAAKEEKKVEYLELIYDLIFVYVIGRNNSLLHEISDGFVTSQTFIAYLLCSLAVIQIWNFSTYYINMHGRNGLRDHICLFINMYLLYYIGEGTRVHWEDWQPAYHIAWALILINIGVQYLFTMRAHRSEPQVFAQTRRMAFVLFGEALIVLLAIPVYLTTGVILAPVAILFGVFATMHHGKQTEVVLVDFPHLTERAMLYVVFTFGEMIIALASYFEGGVTASSLYFSGMSFLIVVGLFLSYGTLYDHLIDRERRDTGLGYMLLHIGIIFALSLITTSLEFMHDETVRIGPKMWMLILAFLLYYVSLFLTMRWSKTRCRPTPQFLGKMGAVAVSFVLLMVVFRANMYINIALTVVYVFGVYALLYRASRAVRDTEG